MAIEAGTRIGRYEIRKPLGAGGMGEVYAALDVKLSRTVALKLLPSEFAQDQKRMQRFVQEARAASSLNHPNIITIHEIEDAATPPFIATEFIDGETLRARLARPLKLTEALDIVTQVASALSAAHAAGIVHRDIKPENIMVRRDGYVKVLDFGLAKLTESRGASAIDTEAATRALVNTDPGAVIGTVKYMSPEQASGKEVDARTDIWSLGVVLYEMVTGRVPFEGSTPSHVIVAILEKEPLPLSAYVEGVPEALEWIVTEALTKDREERTQTARELLKKLQRLKQRVNADADVERSVAPERLSSTGGGGVASGSAASGITEGAQSTVTATERTTAARSGATAQASTAVSSAEYVVNQIKQHKWRFLIVLSLIVAALVGVVFGLYKFFGRDGSARSGAPLKVTPLTSSPYVERNVALSPDGKQVAYSWTGEKNDNFDIYVMLIGAGEPLRMTTNPARDMSPAWSPDSRYIAFERGRGEGKGFYIIPALVGVERKLSDAYEWTGLGVRPQALDWSPDGKTLAVSDKTSEDEPWSIFLISVETGERHRLTQPPAGYNSDHLVTFSPDGSRLAFVRTRAIAARDVEGGPGDIYTVAVAGGEPLRITTDEAVVYGLALTPDGTELVFSSDRGGGDSTLWRVPAAGGTPSPVTGVGENIHELSIARQGDRLAYAQLSVDINIYRVELASQPGGRRGEGGPESVLLSQLLKKTQQQPPHNLKGARPRVSSLRRG